MSRAAINKISVSMFILFITSICGIKAQETDINSIFTWNSINIDGASSQSAIKFTPRAGIIATSWEFGDGQVTTEPNPTHVYNCSKYTDSVTVTLSYTLNGTDLKETKKIKVSAIKEVLANIPNVFTPNNDGVNDLFTVAATGTPRFTLRILSRSGGLLYEHESDIIRWDGRNEQGNELPEGIYYYIIEDLTNTYEPATGFVYLFRGKK